VGVEEEVEVVGVWVSTAPWTEEVVVVTVWALTAPWTEDVVVGAGCSAEVEDRESTCSAVAGEAETAVKVAPFGWEEVRHG